MTDEHSEFDDDNEYYLDINKIVSESDMNAPVWHSHGVITCVKHELDCNTSFAIAWFIGYGSIAIITWILVPVLIFGQDVDRLSFLWLYMQLMGYMAVFYAGMSIVAYGFGYMRYRLQVKSVYIEALGALANEDENGNNTD